MNDKQTRFKRALRAIRAANWTRWLVAALLIFLAYKLGGAGTHSVPSKATGEATSTNAVAEAATIWTCSMHPQIQLPNPGQCPICGMDLIELKDSNDDAGPRAFAMSKSDQALANIQTALAERRFVESELRMAGKVVYDETRVKTVSAWVPGRLERLFVDHTGTAVTKGDHMVLLYSPQLLEAQGSLIEAKKSLLETVNETSQFLRDSAHRHLESERGKLRLWGLGEEQIASIEEKGEVDPYIQINAPLSGIVIHKSAVQGMYVETGTPLYRVADLSVVWIELDVYEIDFPWVRYGQRVDIATEAHPGEQFEGRISFVPPYLDGMTRSKKVRVNVENKELRLNPGMFVRATLYSKLANAGRVMDPQLAGKWICPMHREIVKADAGTCDVCGMDLVTAQSLGYVTDEDAKEAPLVVPATAVLLTGRRGVVYVKVPGTERPTCEGREVVVGPRAGEWYVILEGLTEGEVVVTNGNFKIDSALQILAKPSMMSMPAEKDDTKSESSPENLKAIQPIFDAYFNAHSALSKDDLDAGRAALTSLGKAAASSRVTLSTSKAGKRWSELVSTLEKATEHAAHASDIKNVRDIFMAASQTMLEIEKELGHEGDSIHRVAFCPMAAGGKGASWLQLSENVENPYFGASMFTCGEIRSEHAGMAKKQPGKEAAPSMVPPHEFRTALGPVYTAYLKLHRSLAGDDLPSAKSTLTELSVAVKAVRVRPTGDESWLATQSALSTKLLHAAHVSDLSAARAMFSEIAPLIIEMERTFGHAGTATYRIAFCPMANDGEGGSWIQLAGEVENPFYGASMYRCGEIKSTHEGDGK